MEHPTNYTISSVTYNDVTSGSNVSGIHPTAVLELIPITGYTLNAEDFSMEVLPLGVSSVVFTQNGDNLDCTVTFSSSLIMPSEDLSISLCINGVGVLKQFHIYGQINSPEVFNFSIDPNTTYYFNESGIFENIISIYNVVFTADSGYYFPTTPILKQIDGETDIFNQTSSYTYDLNGNMIACNILLTCTIPDHDSSSNYFAIRASAAEIYAPETLITNYLMDTSYVPMVGDIRTLTLIGVEGSGWRLDSSDLILKTNDIDPITGDYILSNEARGTIDASGMAEITIILPEQTDNTEYSILLSGDIKDPFPSLNPILLEQLKDVEVRLPISGTDVFVFHPNDTSLSRTYSAMSAPPTGVDIAEGTIKWSITSISATPITLLRQPLITDISNWDSITKTTEVGVIEDINLVLGSVTDLYVGMALINPLQHISNYINAIDTLSNIVTLQYPVSILAGTEIYFSYNKSNLLRFTLFAEQIDTYQIDVTVNLNIDQFGWGKQDFTLNPKNFIDY